MRRLLMAAVLVAACSGKKSGAGTGTGTGTATGTSKTSDATPAAIARCLTTLERAATLPSFERGGAIIRGCGVCGRSFDPIIAADRADMGAPVDLEEVWAIVEACGGTCSNQASGSFRNALTELTAGKPSTRPWRHLADSCPAVMHTDTASERFASGAWYALAVIGDKLVAARATLPAPEQARLDAALGAMLLPLPPLTAPGTAFIPPGGALQPGTPWKVITATPDAVFVGRLAFAHLAAKGLSLVDGGTPYPGTRVGKLDELPAALAALAAPSAAPPPTLSDRIDAPVIVAPRAASASLVTDVVSALGETKAYLAIGTPAPAALWRGLVTAHPLVLAGVAPAGHRLRVGLATPRIAVVDEQGAVLASAPLPVPDRPMVERWAAALNAVAQGRTIEVVVENGHVEALAQLLDAAAGGAATMAIPAAKGAALTGNEIAAFSDVALKAKLDAP